MPGAEQTCNHEEPDALIGLVRVCGGGKQIKRSASLSPELTRWMVRFALFSPWNAG